VIYDLAVQPPSSYSLITIEACVDVGTTDSGVDSEYVTGKSKYPEVSSNSNVDGGMEASDTIGENKDESGVSGSGALFIELLEEIRYYTSDRGQTRMWTPSFVLTKEELTSVPVWIKFHGVPVLAFTTDGLSVIATRLGTPIMLDSSTTSISMQTWGRMDYTRALVDIRAHRALKDTMVVSVPDLIDNEKPMDDLVDDTRKKMEAPPKKTPRKIGLYKGIHIDESLTLSHLFYADDAVFVGKWDKSNLITIVNVGGIMSRSSSWEDVLAKISSRLSKWKLKTLSIVPVGVLNRMEYFRRNFFNGVDNKERKIFMIGWKKVLASKKYRGLGVSSFFALNHALLFKYGGPSLMMFSLADIICECDSLSCEGIDLHSHVKKKVGNSELTSFWDDTWLTEYPLKHIYSRLFALECDKHASVAGKLRDSSLIALFRRAPRGGTEEEQLHLLADRVSTVILSSNTDRWVWSFESSGVFSVRSARSFIDDILLPKVGVSTRWVNVVPIKINIFAWRVYLDKLPTRLNLSLRGIDIPSILCLICSIAGESSSHLLFTCQVARHLMFKVARWWELEYQDFHSYADWLTWFINLRLSKGHKEVLEGVFYVMWWAI
ncbi:RNA-directed DNA polymerase, eukaryota, partial [Tanacetum coccineum]